ncbi:DUF6503 family protein [Lewinella sp. IMCC34183]|uniref:DUF6503 family protein n=1 Tax=Lewinella sp. IMCC34183 TaxID=2248762 RepID=UPI000E266A06|nr:DUF6503 family protein [Lewinella sp. IMCC34183]
MKHLLFLLFAGTCVPAHLYAQDAGGLIDAVIEAVGGSEGLHRLEDVQYEYRRSDGSSSLERYRFNQEISYGRSRDEAGHVREEYYNGHTTTLLVDGQLVTDPAEKEKARFHRKTNFYWLAMMHKLKDPGTVHRYAGTDTLEGTVYHLVDVTFEEGVGEARDRYRLYINSKTKLVDRFLYTVEAMNRMTPTLMEVDYKRVAEGVRLPVESRSHPARDWSGTLTANGEWRVSRRDKFRFHNGFTPETIRQ